MPGRAQYEFVQQGEIGIAFVQTASGVRVLSTKPGSQAHQLGVPAGSRLLAVSNTPTEQRSHTEIIALIVSAGRPMSMTFELVPPSALTPREVLSMQEQQLKMQRHEGALARGAEGGWRGAGPLRGRA